MMVSAGMIAGSFTAGTGIYYLHNTQSKQIKKQQIDQLLSLIISFIIYLWIAKIALQLPLLMKSPMAVLAYPSNSLHFYFATGLCLLHTAYIFRKKLNEARLFFQSFSFIMLSTLLVHEFLLIITDVHHQLSLYFICLTALVFCYVLLYQKTDHDKLAVILFGGWLVLAFSVSIYHGYFILFQFMVKPFYFAALLLLLLISSYYTFKKI